MEGWSWRDAREWKELKTNKIHRSWGGGYHINIYIYSRHSEGSLVPIIPTSVLWGVGLGESWAIRVPNSL